jgi:hypothetical protein
MDTSVATIQIILKDTAKAKARIQYFRHIINQIANPDLITQLEDPDFLYESLYTLNQHLYEYETQYLEIEDEAERIIFIERALLNENTTSHALIEATHQEEVTEFCDVVKELRSELDLATSAAKNVYSICHKDAQLD